MPRSSNPAARRRSWCAGRMHVASRVTCTTTVCAPRDSDRKSTRLNSSHTVISYAVFCLKKKKKKDNKQNTQQKKKTQNIKKKRRSALLRHGVMYRKLLSAINTCTVDQTHNLTIPHCVRH